MRLARPLCGASIGMCLGLLSGSAFAADHARPASSASATSSANEATPIAKAEPQAPPSAAFPAQSAAANKEALAQAAYTAALDKYAKGDVQGALDSMRESYDLCHRAELLYNLALLERELHQCRAALDDYTSYLQRVAHGSHRDAAEQASAQLELECPTEPVATAAAPALSTKPTLTPQVDRATDPENRADEHYWTAPHVLAWSAISAGAVAGGGALYFQLAAKSKKDEYQNSVNAAFYEPGMTRDPSLQDKQHRDQTIAQVLAVSGGALVSGGVLVLILGDRTQKTEQAQTQIRVLPGSLEASYTQRF